jgi:hypothetical protein
MATIQLAGAGHPRRDWLSPALLSGFIASAAMLFAFAVAYGAAALQASVALADRPYAATLRQWLHGLTRNVVVDLAGPNLYEATGVFFVGGLVWAVVYAAVFHPRLRGPGWQRGLLFSLVPGLFSLVVFLPLVGGGPFGLGLGAGPFPLIGTLLLHAVYGLVLAAMYGPFGDRPVDGRRGALAGDDAWGMPSAEAGAARGLVGGMALGGLLGLAGLVAPPSGDMASLLGLHPLSFPIAGVLLGGGFGLFLGSLCGLPAGEPTGDGAGTAEGASSPSATSSR